MKGLKMKPTVILLVAGLLFAPTIASAEGSCCKGMMQSGGTGSVKMAESGAGHDMHDMHDMKTGDLSKGEAAAAFAAVNAKMHAAMTIEFSGDPDVDFMTGMIPHHQGAIDMANVLLKYGKDAETRKLAEEIIKAQDSEIAMMKAWLAKRKK